MQLLVDLECDAIHVPVAWLPLQGFLYQVGSSFRLLVAQLVLRRYRERHATCRVVVAELLQLLQPTADIPLRFSTADATLESAN